MKPGTLVRMSEELKQAMIGNGCAEHIEEFGDCIGVVDGLLDYGTFQGPEVDVRWQPSNLRYGYNPDDLVIVGEKLYRNIDETDERNTRQDSPLLKSRLALRAKMRLRPA